MKVKNDCNAVDKLWFTHGFERVSLYRTACLYFPDEKETQDG